MLTTFQILIKAIYILYQVLEVIVAVLRFIVLVIELKELGDRIIRGLKTLQTVISVVCSLLYPVFRFLCRLVRYLTLKMIEICGFSGKKPILVLKSKDPNNHETILSTTCEWDNEDTHRRLMKNRDINYGVDISSVFTDINSSFSDLSEVIEQEDLQHEDDDGQDQGKDISKDDTKDSSTDS